ncbi:MAG: hypothetical protein P4L45_03560 [Ignavibacteriaceae bacterium]|nr:hypothetical protein [Ignavibacteriaceae bacterium]
MNRKTKNTLALFGVLILLLLLGGSYIFLYQRHTIKEDQKQLESLKSNQYNTDQLNMQYYELQKKAAKLDSVLAQRKFNIPQNLSSISFFNFINKVSANFSTNTQVNIDYNDQKKDKDFHYYEYKLTGNGDFNDLFRLIYAIEQSKELKKVKSVSLSNYISSQKEGMPTFLVNFTILADVYFADNNRFSTAEFVENNLNARPVYDIFYPLIRTQIPPNLDNLLDVQGAKLLALIPEGAFIADIKGNTYLLWEGQQVYLGYLTKIDYDHNTVSFILNKGGIIEKVDLSLEKEGTYKKKP